RTHARPSHNLAIPAKGVEDDKATIADIVHDHVALRIRDQRVAVCILSWSSADSADEAHERSGAVVESKLAILAVAGDEVPVAARNDGIDSPQRVFARAVHHAEFGDGIQLDG